MFAWPVNHPKPSSLYRLCRSLYDLTSSFAPVISQTTVCNAYSKSHDYSLLAHNKVHHTQTIVHFFIGMNSKWEQPDRRSVVQSVTRTLNNTEPISPELLLRLIKYILTLYLFITNKPFDGEPVLGPSDYNCWKVLLTRVSERSSALGDSTGG